MQLLCPGALRTVRQLLFPFLKLIERQGRTDEAHVGKRLWKVSQCVSGYGINFFAI